MIWVTWRQFRAQGMVAAAALAVLATALAVTGPHLASMYRNSGLAACTAGCGPRAGSFIDAIKGSSTELLFYTGIFLLIALPALIGIFWGAPLITRELESGTYRVSWNQSVTRARWLAVKLGLVGLLAAATTGLLSLMVSWWASPLYAAARQAAAPNSLSISRFAPPLYSANGIAPVGYALFAFALGVTTGVLLRRTVPTMAITLALFAAVQILMPTFVRPHLLPPVTSTRPLSAVSFDGIGVSENRLLLQVGSISGDPADWIISSQPVNSAGQPVTIAPAKCAALNNMLPCLASNGIRMRVSYQPASRYWAFQWLETGIFTLLALGLGGVCYWRIRRLS